MIRALMRATPWLLCATALVGTALAQTATNENNTAKVIPGQIVVNEATRVVQNMKQDADVAGLMDHAKAVLIVPRYDANPARLSNRAERDSPEGNTAHASEALLRHGSPGVFLVHTAGWSAPAFFSVSDVAISNSEMNDNMHNNTDEHGVPLALMFMTAHAADQMRAANNVSLSGLSVARYSDRAHGARSDADVVVWTPHHMMHVGDLAAAQIHFDSTASNAYYMNQATLGDILSNSVSTPRASELQGALSTRVASSK